MSFSLFVLSEIILTKQEELNKMSIIFLLTGISLVLAIGFLCAFLWAIKNGQYEDDYTPSVRVLFEDSKKEKKSNENKNQKQ